MNKTVVSIVKTHPEPDYPQIRKAVEEALELIGGIKDIIQPGHLVLINPSWVAPPVDRAAGCITIPEVSRGHRRYREGNGRPPGDCRIFGHRCENRHGY